MNNIKELTLRGMLLGSFVTVIFTASNVYLGLKVGLTFSSAIPAAVISMAILRFFSGVTRLENNMVQTQASAAGTLSSVIFVLPGLLMIGYWQDFPFWNSMLICASGGILGVLFSIPLRHAMVVKSDLPYPEGVAAAEILKVGNDEFTTPSQDKNLSGNSIKDMLFGSIVAATVNFLTTGMRVISDNAAYWFTQGKAIFQLPMGFSLALLSAGYLVGVMSGIAILVGGIIAWGVGIPLLTAGRHYAENADFSAIAMALWKKEVRYVGAGTLAVASLWTLFTLIKPIIGGLQTSFRTLKAGHTHVKIERTEQDLSPKTIILLMLGMFVILIATFYNFVMDSGLSLGVAWSLVIFSVFFAFIMGFLVAAACGYMAGLVGSSASPISGIGIIAVTVVSLLLVVIGEFNGMFSSPQGTKFATALALFTTSAVFAIAAISNDNLQDLKTGYLLKATPWCQQVALLIGCVVGALVIAPILDILYNAYGFTGAMPRDNMDLAQVLSAPQATMMKTIAEGIFAHNLAWNMIVIGLVLGVVIIIIDMILQSMHSKFRLPALAVGMGIYLPPAITTPLILGALLSWVLRKKVAKCVGVSEFKSAHKKVDRRAALIASGMIVGESLVGVAMAMAMVIVISLSSGGSDAPLSLEPWLQAMLGDKFGIVAQFLGLAIFITVCLAFIRRAMSALKNK